LTDLLVNIAMGRAYRFSADLGTAVAVLDSVQCLL
jgi:hypothetical protein